MDFSRLQRGVFAAQNQNRTLRWGMLILLVANVILAAATFSQQAIVTVMPPNMNKAARVSVNSANAAYKKAWGLLVADLLGNVRPGKGEFIINTLGPILSSELYRPVTQAIKQQAREIKKNQITATFRAQRITYDPNTNTVYVVGQQTSKGPGSDPLTSARTYEMTIAIRNYHPVLTALDIYEHEPDIDSKG